MVLNLVACLTHEGCINHIIEQDTAMCLCLNQNCGVSKNNSTHRESAEHIHASDKGLYISIQCNSWVIQRFVQRSQFFFIIVSQLFGFVLSITVYFFILSLGYSFLHYFKTTIKVTKNFFYFILQLCTKDLAKGSMKGLGDFPPKVWITELKSFCIVLRLHLRN